MKKEIEFSKSFTNWLEFNSDAEKYGLCDPPLNAQAAINFLYEYLLGPDWYVAISENTEQVNTVIVQQILLKYSDEYQIEFARWQKFNKLKKSNYNKKTLLYKLFKWGFYGKRYQKLLKTIEVMNDIKGEDEKECTLKELSQKIL